jgi:hypothetical protein
MESTENQKSPGPVVVAGAVAPGEHPRSGPSRNG